MNEDQKISAKSLQQNVFRKVYIVCVFLEKKSNIDSSPEQQIMSVKYT
jgi:hypothetical protein